jgi:hypothetical protein
MPDPENPACVKALFTLICGSHELLVSCENLKDIVLHKLTDGIPVDCPCRGERRRVLHEENENCLTLKKSIRFNDLGNGVGHDLKITAFFKGLESRVIKSNPRNSAL